MSTATKEKTIYTTREAAEELGITDGRIRQLCIFHRIGKKFGHIRMLSIRDLKRIQAVRKNLDKAPD